MSTDLPSPPLSRLVWLRYGSTSVYWYPARLISVEWLDAERMVQFNKTAKVLVAIKRAHSCPPTEIPLAEIVSMFHWPIRGGQYYAIGGNDAVVEPNFVSFLYADIKKKHRLATDIDETTGTSVRSRCTTCGAGTSLACKQCGESCCLMNVKCLTAHWNRVFHNYDPRTSMPIITGEPTTEDKELLFSEEKCICLLNSSK